MTYDEAIEWLLSFADFERSGRFQDRPDVAPMLALLERLGNPHLGRTTVHIAGSKGKGSVAAMVNQMVFGSGICTGLYTSPHLYSYCERIDLDGGYITESEFARLAAKLLRSVRRATELIEERRLVTFDLLTALAFLAFRDSLKHRLEAQIVEVGLGGRVDSTNVFRVKEVAVITPISLEHANILGGTIDRIAREKAAIITPECVTVMAPQAHDEATRVVEEHARNAGSELVDVAREFKGHVISHDLYGQNVSIAGPSGIIEARVPLLGMHQLENAASALAAVEALRTQDPESWEGRSLEQAAESLGRLKWPCRIEVVREDPLVIVDGAHNRDSARRLAETLVEYFACDRALFIIGCGSDKDIEGLAEELAPLASRVIAVRSEHPRAMAPQLIADTFGRLGVDSQIVGKVGDAVDAAIAAGGDGALICVAGSLFVAAEARAHVLGVRT